MAAVIVLAAAAHAVAAQPSTQSEPGPLRVCMSEDSPPQSQVRRGQASGLDVRLAQAVAQASGRPLRIVPFETEFEKESTLAHEVNALLSSGQCDLVSGFPLLRSDLGPASRPRARAPDHPGAPRKRERPFVALGELVASTPYQAVALGLVQAPSQPQVGSLMDLRGRNTGVVAGTLAGSVLSLYAGGALRKHMVSLSQREDPWVALALGRIDALLLPTQAYDAQRLRQPQMPWVLTAWRRPIGVNLGFVALASAPPELLALSNRVIAQALGDGRLKQWAQEEGLSWQPPSEPAVSEGVSWQSLMRD